MKLLSSIPLISLLLLGCATDSRTLVCGTFDGERPADIDVKTRKISLQDLGEGPKLYYIFDESGFAVLMSPEDVIDILGNEKYTDRYSSEKYIEIIKANPLVADYTDLNVYMFMESGFGEVAEKVVFDAMSAGKVRLINLNENSDQLDRLVTYNIKHRAGSGVQYCTADGRQIAQKVLTIIG